MTVPRVAASLLLGILFLLLPGCASAPRVDWDQPGIVSTEVRDFIGSWKGSLAHGGAIVPGVARLDLRPDGTAVFSGGPRPITGTWRVVGNYMVLSRGRDPGFTAYKLLSADDGQLAFKFSTEPGYPYFARLQRDPAGIVAATAPVPGLVAPMTADARPRDFLGTWNGPAYQWVMNPDGTGALRTRGSGQSLWSGEWIKVGNFIMIDDPIRGFCTAMVVTKTPRAFAAMRQSGAIETFTLQ